MFWFRPCHFYLHSCHDYATWYLISGSVRKPCFRCFSMFCHRPCHFVLRTTAIFFTFRCAFVLSNICIKRVQGSTPVVVKEPVFRWIATKPNLPNLNGDSMWLCCDCCLCACVDTLWNECSRNCWLLYGSKPRLMLAVGDWKNLQSKIFSWIMEEDAQD